MSSVLRLGSLSTQPILVPHCTANESRDKSYCLSVCACLNRSIGLMVRAVGAVVLSVRIQGPINTARWWNGSTEKKRVTLINSCINSKF